MDKFWSSIRRYPIVLLFAGLVGGVPIGWFYGVKSAIEQLPIPAAKATAYTTLSNEELKTKSLHLVAAVRELTRSYHQEDARLRMSNDEYDGKATSQAERDRMRKIWIDESAQLHDRFMERYQANYWAEAILLRQAIMAKIGGAPGAQNPILFQHPTNILGVEQVANGLELLGKSLPGQ